MLHTLPAEYVRTGFLTKKDSFGVESKFDVFDFKFLLVTKRTNPVTLDTPYQVSKSLAFRSRRQGFWSL